MNHVARALPPLSLHAAARTHRGRRSTNEDAHVVDLDHGLFVVADGMGGYEGGEVASRLVVHTIHDFFLQNELDGELTWPWGVDADRGLVENLVTVGIRLANLEVVRRRRGRLAQMGSTVVAVALDGDRLAVAHVGDSRIYRLRSGALEPLTRDHSFVEQLRQMGVTERPEGMGHIITKAIGFAADAEPDVRLETVQPGDAILLCSDGLTDPLDDDTVARLLGCGDAEMAAEALVEAAYEAGGTDNITALVVLVGR